MKTQTCTLSILALSCLLLSACLSEGPGLQVEESEIYELRDQYPEGPYGTELGQVIKPLSFLDPNGANYGLEDVYRDQFNQVLLVTTSAEWCTACIKEQKTLNEIYDEYKDRGLEVMVTLFQDLNFEPATAELSERWRERYELDFPVVADPTDPSLFAPYYDISLTPMVMLVNVKTMEIIYLTQGFDEDQVRALIEANLPQKLRSRSYPGEPYGKTVDTTIEALEFVNPDETTFSTASVYEDLSKRLLLVTTSAEWCTACIKEQPTLQSMYEEYKEAGLEILVSLFQDRDFEPASADLAQRWIDKYDLSFLVVADPTTPSKFSPYYDVSLTPMVMLIDTETMEIIYLTQGFDEDQVRGLIEAKLGLSQ